MSEASEPELVVRVERGSRPIAGSILDGERELPFSGWLELTSRLEEARAPRMAPRAEGRPPCPPQSGSTSAAT